MNRFKELNRYQKGLLLVMTVMVLLFAILYTVTVGRVGFLYHDTILTPDQENGTVTYSGKINGQPAQFTVDAHKTVIFQYGEKTYGPYTAREDPAAIPRDTQLSEHMTGVELRCGTQVVFRGGLMDFGEQRLLFDEDGSVNSLTLQMGYDANSEHENGKQSDPMEPAPITVLELMGQPSLTHKGLWLAWFSGVLLCAVNGISILFADEFFRRRLSFLIRDAGNAEPSEWEMERRYLGWTALPIIALVLFLMGLQ